MFTPTNLEHLRQLKTEQIISLYLGKEITGDFIFCSLQRAELYNQFAQEENKQIADNFRIFAETGQGDFWLMDKQQQIYFYDHDLEDFCPQNLQALNIDLTGWLMLADLFQRKENLEDQDNYSEQAERLFMAEVNQICPKILSLIGY